MRRSLLGHVAYTLLGLLCWVGFVGALLRDAFGAWVELCSNKDPL